MKDYVISSQSLKSGETSDINFFLDNYKSGAFTEHMLFALVQELARRVGEELGSDYRVTAKRISTSGYRGIFLSIKKL